jgi:hypothetical protein
VETAKRLLWDSCSQSLEVANLPFQVRRDSENRTQLTANLDDMVVAFDALDARDLIPPMFCEASDLVRLPPLSLNPVAEQVNLNSESLTALAATVQGLEGKLYSFLSSFSSTVKNDPPAVDGESYAARASSVFPPVPASPSSPKSSGSIRSPAATNDDRGLNLILFGLPESQSILDLKKIVDEMLEFLAETPYR